MNDQAIGGYFGLEGHTGQCLPFTSGVALNSGRNALEYILKSRPNIQHVYLPVYMCPVVLQPLIHLGLEWSFYRIDSTLSPIIHSPLSEHEAMLLVNYFGVCDKLVLHTSGPDRNRLIVDASQAFFFRPPSPIAAFYSPRKFFGVPDGGFAINVGHDLLSLDQDISHDRCLHLLKRLDLGAESGYVDFAMNEQNFNNRPLRKMSRLTTTLLSDINYAFCAQRRRDNFRCLHAELSPLNKLDFKLEDDSVPMVYPLWIKSGACLREALRVQRIYCAQYWPELPVAVSPGSVEHSLQKDLVALPIDQRYGNDDMARILMAIDTWTKAQCV